MSDADLAGVLTVDELIANLPKAKRMLLFLDYDGTLTPYTLRPEDAKLDAETYAILESLLNDPRLQIVLTSGRAWPFLEEQAGSLRVDLAAEHGLFFKRHGTTVWHIFVDAESISHLREFRPMLEKLRRDVPGSFVEEKEFSLVWHYRAAAENLESAITCHADDLAAVLPPELRLCRGHKILEIRPGSEGKGTFIEWYLSTFLNGDIPELLLALGDDSTDEEMYPVIDRYRGITVRVGPGETKAKFRLKSHVDVLEFLKRTPEALLSP